jgi:hypothetical protein
MDNLGSEEKMMGHLGAQDQEVGAYLTKDKEVRVGGAKDKGWEVANSAWSASPEEVKLLGAKDKGAGGVSQALFSVKPGALATGVKLAKGSALVSGSELVRLWLRGASNRIRAPLGWLVAGVIPKTN